ncbi:hypothetical protein BDV12DRAFT_15668 [Aspergillus spectabilis]
MFHQLLPLSWITAVAPPPIQVLCMQKRLRKMAKENTQPPESRGEARILGSSADRAFINRLRVELGEWPGADYERRLTARDPQVPRLFPRRMTLSSSISLPSFQRAEELVNLALDAHILYQVIHRPKFDHTMRLLFTLDRCDYGREEISALPLAYALMALGTIYEKHDDMSMETGTKSLAERTGYFETCRDLIDLGDCSDHTTLQAVFYMNLFLLATARMGSCYTYLSHALSLAYRLNLHQPDDQDDTTTAEVKGYLFWSIKQLLVFAASGTGFPRPIVDEESDLPHLADIEHPTFDTHQLGHDRPAINPPGFVHFIRLHSILDRVVKALYPDAGATKTRRNGTTSHPVSNETIVTLEQALQMWANSLPAACRLNRSAFVPYLRRANYELHMTFCHFQTFLYRPFLHYLLKQNDANQDSDEIFQMYASACIHASCNIIRLAEDMYQNGLLFGSEWRVPYMVAGASLSLLYVLVGCKGSATADDVMVHLSVAKWLLDSLRPHSTRSRRPYLMLTVLTAAFSNHPQPSQANPSGNERLSKTLYDTTDFSRTALLGEQALLVASCGNQNFAFNAAGSKTGREGHTAPTEALPTPEGSTSVAISNSGQDPNLISGPSQIDSGGGFSTPPLMTGMAPEIDMPIPNLPFSENAFYLEARPFTFPHTNSLAGDSFLQFLDSEGADLEVMAGNLPDFAGIF